MSIRTTPPVCSLDEAGPRKRLGILRGALLALAALSGFTLTNPAQASNADYGYVRDVQALDAGAYLFYQVGPREPPPACVGPGLQQRWAINISSPGGQAQLSSLLTAIAMHKRVYILGTGTCSYWGDTETAWFIEVEN